VRDRLVISVSTERSTVIQPPTPTLLRTPSTGGSCNAWTMCHGTVTSRNINRVRCTRFPSWRPSTVHHSQDIHFFFLGHLPMFRTHVLPRSIIIVIISITSPTVHPQLRVCLAAKPLSVMHSAFPSNVDQPSRGATSSELVWIPAHSRNLNCRRRIDWLNGNPKFSQRATQWPAPSYGSSPCGESSFALSAEASRLKKPPLATLIGLVF